MPVAAPPTPAHFSLFSSLRHVFHSPSHHNPSAVAPDPPLLPTPSPASSSPALDHRTLHLYQAFESSLAQRLSSLSPADDSSPCLHMACLTQFLQVLLSTQADLSTLVPAHRSPLSQAQAGVMAEFLERSVKVLDVCRLIKEQISVVESLQGLLRAVLSILSPKNGGVLHTAQVVRARKMLAELLLHMEVERGEEPPAAAVCAYRSFRLRCRGNGSGGSVQNVTQRWRSWHGSGRLTASPLVSNLSDLSPSRHLQGMLSALHAPKIPAGDADDLFCTAMYAQEVISIFFLGALSASLPSLDRICVPNIAPPRALSWARPLVSFQERVQEEMRCRNKKSNSYAGMWELDEIATIVSRLFDLTEGDESAPDEKVRDEIKNLVKQLQQHVEELDRGMGHLYSQIMDFYNTIISSRMDVLSKSSNLRP